MIQMGKRSNAKKDCSGWGVWECLEMWGIGASLRCRASCLPNTSYWGGSTNSVVIREIAKRNVSNFGALENAVINSTCVCQK